MNSASSAAATKPRAKPFLDRSEWLFDSTSALSFVARQERRDELDNEMQAQSACSSVLVSSDFDPMSIRGLAVRRFHVYAVNCLIREGKLFERHLAAMREPAHERLKAFRFALAFGVISPDSGPAPFLLDDLKNIDTEESACALAACGLIDWDKEKRRRPRAIYVLRELLGSRRP